MRSSFNRLTVQGEEIHTLYRTERKSNAKKFILNKLETSFKDIENAYVNLIRESAGSRSYPKGAEWLLDNFYFIELAYRRLKNTIKEEKIIILNMVKDGPYRGYPRIYALAVELINDSTGNITEDRLIRFINSFQKEEILSMDEISWFPGFLVLGLIEYIKNISISLLDMKRKWDEADKLDILTDESMEKIIEEAPNMDSIKLERVIRRIREERDDFQTIIDSIDEKLDYAGRSIENILEREYMLQSKYKVYLGYGITSLRNVTVFDWENIFKSIRAIDNILSMDPLNIYDKMDSQSKNYYRYYIKELAEKFNTQEIFVAKKALEFAEEEYENGARDKKAHIGYYLIDEGRKKLFDYFGCRNANHTLYVRRFGYYSLPIIAISLLITYIVMRIAAVDGNPYLNAFGFLILFIPLESIVLNIANSIYIKRFKPKLIPKIEYFGAIPEDKATLVVIPTLIVDKSHLEELVEKLEVCYLSNNEDNIYFAIMGDFKDADEKDKPEDAEIINRGVELIEKLNRKYSKGKDIFFYLHRERVFSDAQGSWIGWERKRGALVELNNLLTGDENTRFKAISGDISGIRGKIKYVITIDADTHLPIDSAKKLIGAISHPLNKAVVDEEKGIVVEGYGIIQPRILVDIESSNKTLFTRIFAGHGGMDIYGNAISDIYQDLFGEGIFTGKGIYDLEVFQRCLKGAIPENMVLSHDLLEGSYIRTGLATDIKLLDGYPEKYISYLKRQHRWVRGDWQLLRWITESLGRNLSILSKWKMIDNLRRSLLPIFLFIAVFLGTAFFEEGRWIFIGVAVTNLFLQFIMEFIQNLFRGKTGFNNVKYNGNIIVGYRSTLYQGMLNLMFLPTEAFFMADAIIRTLYRVYISKRNLLEWTTAFEAERNSKNDLSGYISMMKGNIIFSVLLVSIVLFRDLSAFLSGFIFSMLWLSGPFIAFNISRGEMEVLEKKEEDKRILLDIASKTWNYYREFTDKENNYLPPDNYQEYPYNGVANRTSPTNIGFYLLSVLSSRDLGFIDTKEMIALVNRTLDTIERLKKWEGHLYNWYDTTNLEPLRPIFVSTVDSGNFIAYLIVLKEGIKEYMHELENKEDAEKTIERIENIINNTNFKPLYDESKDLFYIGYNVGEGKTLNNYYDLLASEARISSYIAISRREVPVRNWERLGKSLVKENGSLSLASWSGTMFEYLMPSLVMKNYKNTLLDETYRTTINVQKEYGKKNNVPWGISESGFFAFDNVLNYQYKAFGVPSLGFKRGLKEELVVSPYSTFLALNFDYQGVMDNIKRLIDEGMEGPYGFYEAVDYTVKRLPPHLNKGIVKSYMSHHQGMIFAAINNFINDGILIKRFHRDPLMKCGEFLLQERIPDVPVISKGRENLEQVEIIRKREDTWEKIAYSKEHVESIRCHLLSSDSYTLMITNRGEGFSKDGNTYINRWRRDYLTNPYGQFIYIKDIKNNKCWSATYAPYYSEPDSYDVEFHQYKAVFRRRDGCIETRMDIYLLPEESGEIRKVRITNDNDEEALIESISYFEVVGENINSDLAHPAFSNLFIRTEVVEDLEGLLAYRRKRHDDQRDVWIVHFVRVFQEGDEKFQYETSRLNFIGRSNSLSNPKAMEKGLTNTTGVVLDPVMSIGKKIKIPPKGKFDIFYITALANSKSEALDILKKYSDKNNIKLAVDLYRTKSQTEMGYLNLNRRKANPYEELLPKLIYLTDNNKSRYSSIIRKNTKGKEGLWARGISGDNPILLVTISSMKGMANLVKILEAHEYWSYRGIPVDLIILNKDESAYYQPLYESIREEVYEKRGIAGRVFIINENTIPEEDRVLLYKFANVIVKAEESFKNMDSTKHNIPYKTFVKDRKVYEKKEINLDLKYFNEYGGFSKDGREYIIKLSKGINTPMPWINVVSNRDFGFIITEQGSGFTWSKNSRENKLTPWYNDPITDHQGEIIYLMDEDSGEVFTITPKPVRDDNDYIVIHGQGYTRFYHNCHGIEQNLMVFVPKEDNIKISLIRLRNESNETRKLSLYYYIRPVLGVTDEETEKLLETDVKDDVLIVRNTANSEFKGSTMFVGSSESIDSYTGDRIEFLGTIPNYEMPEGLKRQRLSNTLGLGYNPCIAFKVNLLLSPGEEKELTLLMGESNEINEGLQLINKYRDVQLSKKALEEVKALWDEILSRIYIETPDDTLNFMMNSWLMYQTIASRIWGRTGFYQVGGAFGARDQMQDVTNIIYHMSDLTKNQIIRNCAHQYKEGDIQHWWHPIPGSEVHKGIRSKYTDDLLWLPLGVAKYIKVTGDTDILNERIPFIESGILKENEEERYEVPKISQDTGTVYEHCIRAIDRSLRFGKRGLPLMGGGDWNDGMNKVGYKGKGESVWMGWFLATVLKSFIPVCEIMKDEERIRKYEEAISALKKSLEENAWDGEWYRRAYFDNGTPLGSRENSECIIDSIAQSWAVISGLGDEKRVRIALNSVEKYLIDENSGTISLLSPPFDSAELDPGYIKSYVPGVRENGGQYTHAAIWVVKAFAMMGDGDRAYSLFKMINPINHSRTFLEASNYKVEPYVVAADVYTNPQHKGRGGWTWYTGSSGWMYIVGLEDIIGFSIEKNRLYINPCIPKSWRGFNIRYRYGNTMYLIEVKNENKVNKGVKNIFVDNVEINEKFVELTDDGNEHHVLVNME